MNKFEGKFQAAYAGLNDEQKQAVDQIDGPVLVLAGPGTGKTQLLSMRVANILRQTDAQPQNILCLTFTEAAAANMTDRMAGLFGPEAYKVSVNTFHGFCSGAMNQFSQYFYHGARLTAASELQKAEIISDILRDLPYDNPLSGSFGDLPTYLKSAQSAISHLKRQAGLTPEKLRQLTEQNLDFIDFIESEMTAAFAKPFGRKKSDMTANIAQILPAAQKIGTYPHPEYSLAELIASDFAAAVETAQRDEKTTALTAFRNLYVDHKKAKMSDRARSLKLLALADVYEKYDQVMYERGLFDFDDMILNVGEMLSQNADFKADLQERYQYILIDEFQDTNDAQMNLIYSLTDYDNPNLMVVGDDDQAIYSFQGANVNNVTKFIKRFAPYDVKKIQLYRNYRSVQPILELADSVINASETRIKKSVFDQVADLLVNVGSSGAKLRFLSGETAADEYNFVAEEVAKMVSSPAEQALRAERSNPADDTGLPRDASVARNDKAGDIAIIGKKHADLLAVLPYLEAAGVNNIVYENRQNALDSPVVKQLELLARVVVYLGNQRNAAANTILPELLAHPAFDLQPLDLWQLSLSVERGALWLEQMLQPSLRAERSNPADKTGLPRDASVARNDQLADIANWLIEMSVKVKDLTLEQALDELFARYHQDYFFNPSELAAHPDRYIEYLTDLQTIRQVVRDQQSTDTPSLAQFIEILDLHRHYDIPISALRQFGGDSRVYLLTAHKAKGLEFDTVFILDSSSQKWLRFGGGRNSITPPSNLPISADQDENELWRLLFVAITRAKRQLFLTHHAYDAKGKPIKPLELDFSSEQIGEIKPRKTTPQNPDPIWNAALVQPTPDLRELLSQRLAEYKLNATALNSYTNLEYAGPQTFLLNNLLRFPSAKSAQAEFGSAIHETLKAAHQFFQNRAEKMPIAQAHSLFTADLTARHLSAADHEFYLEKGKNLLETYLNWADFNAQQIVERKITARVGEATLTGNLDLLQIDKSAKTITVYDYKTGAPFDKFDSGTKFKTHGYKQQLMFYKLLLANCPEYANYRIEQGTLHFVEPVEGQIKTLSLTYSDAEMTQFAKLVQVIWQKIQNLNFPDVSKYEKNLRGSLAFEKDLLND